MVDSLVVNSLQNSIGKIIVFWDYNNRRNEGRILDCSENYIKILDSFKNIERLIRFEDIKEVNIL